MVGVLAGATLAGLIGIGSLILCQIEHDDSSQSSLYEEPIQGSARGIA